MYCRKNGNCKGSRETIKQGKVCLLRWRKSLDAKPGFCCLSLVFCMLRIPANVWTQVFIGFDWNCSVASAFASFRVGFFYCCCFATHSHLCYAHEDVLAERWRSLNVVHQEPLRIRNWWFYLKKVGRRVIQSLSDLFLSSSSTNTNSKKGR